MLEALRAENSTRTAERLPFFSVRLGIVAFLRSTYSTGQDLG